MKFTIKLAEKEQVPFVASIAKNNKIISSSVCSVKEPTAHAEITAIRNACKKLGKTRLDNCSIYTTCESCPMCLTACYFAGIKEIVYGATLNDSIHFGFNELVSKELKNKIMKRNVTIKGEFMRKECVSLFQKYAKKLLQKKSA